ncbi:Eukaryotic translation initiation factor 3 subunit E, partial [Blyttiomyces sp. JEL0837]
MAKHDLTNRMGEYLDRHMVLPLLEFLALKEIYSPKDLINAKYELLTKTDMIDFVNQIYKEAKNTEENIP